MHQLPTSIDGLALFLDFDGTLVDLAPRPDLVHLPDPVRDSLRSLAARTGGALALVSGRPIAEIDHYLAPLQLPAAGLHGAERRSIDGTIRRFDVDRNEVAAMRRAAQAFVDATPGLLLEDKGIGIAIHYRQAPEHADAVRRLAITLIAPRRRSFTVQPGKMVVEIKPRGLDKGSAIAAFMQEAPFAGRRAVFLGDDLTDEKGFAALRRLGGAEGMGGIGVKVGEGPTIAPCRLPDVAAVHHWLADLAAHAPSAH